MVQAGNFGPMFYGPADDQLGGAHVSRPATARNRGQSRLCPKPDCGSAGRGARYVGTMSMSWNYGDHEIGKGLWQVWDRLWMADLLGSKPLKDA